MSRLGKRGVFLYLVFSFSSRWKGQIDSVLQLRLLYFSIREQCCVWPQKDGVTIFFCDSKSL